MAFVTSVTLVSFPYNHELFDSVEKITLTLKVSICFQMVALHLFVLRTSFYATGCVIIFRCIEITLRLKSLIKGLSCRVIVCSETSCAVLSHCFIGRTCTRESMLLGPIYKIANTQRIKIYPGKLEFSLHKISSDSKRLHCKSAKDNQTLATFLAIGNLSGLPCLHECKYGGYQNLCNHAVNLPR